ncbi:hypothetical protein DKT68_15225 [Micromonospora acroterricola]|uniref:Uncharacterized protein n=2 Tax=Micromonospora acroterricola TaxID=2202421 RepID=A0A317D490_9ACTN|nr:hypothetical protein DKT68_15225 [Micromonospora acroterricola]
MRLLTPATGVVLVAFAAAVAVSWTAFVSRVTHNPEPIVGRPTFSVAGAIRLQPGDFERHGQTCQGTKLTGDSQVIVTDSAGASLTYAPLAAGRLRDGACELPFTLVIPAGEGPYGLDIPTVGLMPYTEQELTDLIDITFG